MPAEAQTIRAGHLVQLRADYTKVPQYKMMSDIRRKSIRALEGQKFKVKDVRAISHAGRITVMIDIGMFYTVPEDMLEVTLL